MQNEKLFILKLSNNQDTISELSFSADQFNPSTRNDVDAREIFSFFSKKIQKLFIKRNLNFDYNGYNLLAEYKKTSQLNSRFNDNNKFAKPKVESINFNVANNDSNTPTKVVITGVKLTISLTIRDVDNENIIIERDCYIDKDQYNPEARFSVELIELLNDLKYKFIEYLKNKDIKLMWEDFHLINKYSMHITEIRELTKEKRYELVRKLK